MGIPFRDSKKTNVVKGARPRKGIMNLLLVSLTADSDDRVAESKGN